MGVTILKWGFMYLHMSFLTAMTKLVRTVRTQLVRTVRTVGGPHLTYAQQCDAYHQAGVDFPIAADAAKLSALVFTVGFFLVLTVMYAFASIPEDSAKEASSITDKAMLKKNDQGRERANFQPDSQWQTLQHIRALAARLVPIWRTTVRATTRPAPLRTIRSKAPPPLLHGRLYVVRV